MTDTDQNREAANFPSHSPVPAGGATPITEQTRLSLRSVGVGRVLLVQPDGTLFAGKGLQILRGRVGSHVWGPMTRLPSPLLRGIVGRVRLGARLLRMEVRAMGVLSTGAVVASNRQWVYYARPSERKMRRASVEEGSQRLFPPMMITVGPGDRVLWGEYDSHTAHGKPVRLYVSDDAGKTYSIARVFEGGSILHVHNLIFDPTIRKYWLLAGDHNHEPGIGILSEDLKDFDWLVKGKQEHRAVDIFDFGDRLVYGMDSEKEANAVISLDKKSGRIERHTEIDGSCIYSCKFGGLHVLSTTVEPSAVNKGRHAGLWVSRDGDRWTRVYQAEKDRWDPRYFQYGSIVLPRGATRAETIVFSGQALQGLDGRIMEGRLTR